MEFIRSVWECLYRIERYHQYRIGGSRLRRIIWALGAPALGHADPHSNFPPSSLRSELIIYDTSLALTLNSQPSKPTTK